MTKLEAYLRVELTTIANGFAVTGHTLTADDMQRIAALALEEYEMLVNRGYEPYEKLDFS